MTEPGPEIRTFAASDGYPLHIACWPTAQKARGQVVVLHGVQSHGGWYHRLGHTLAKAGYVTSFPDRRGSGANQRERGHASSGRRLILDLVEWLRALRRGEPTLPLSLAAISWGAKVAVIVAARYPELVDSIALVCPGLHPRVGVTRKERLQIAWAFLTNRKKTFPIPLSDPALFTESPEGQAFISADPLGLREGTAGLLAASFFIDRRVVRAPAKIHQPALLMLAGLDRIADNERTRAYFDRIASVHRKVIEYPECHHTLEFEPDPSRYALDLVEWFSAVNPVTRMPGSWNRPSVNTGS
jgi:alpha-beta hydrolase superfamily lysophospholipase